MKKHRSETKFLDQIKEIPVISLACKKTHISRNTIYRWCKEDPEFKKRLDEALEYGQSSVNDLAESKLISLVNDGELKAIKYWLDNNKKNYARPRPKTFWEDFLMREDPVTQITIESIKNKGNLKSDESDSRQSHPNQH